MRTPTFTDRQIAATIVDLAVVYHLVWTRANPKLRMVRPRTWEQLDIPDRHKMIALVRRLLQSPGQTYQPEQDAPEVLDPLSLAATEVDMHNYLVARLKADGWVHGKVLDEDAKVGPHIAAWEQVSVEQRFQTTVMVATVRVLGTMPKEFG